MIVFLTFGQEFSRVLHTFGTDTSNWEERRCVSRDAVPRTCCFGGWFKRNSQRFKQKWDGNIDKNVNIGSNLGPYIM